MKNKRIKAVVCMFVLTYTVSFSFFGLIGAFKDVAEAAKRYQSYIAAIKTQINTVRSYKAQIEEIKDKFNSIKKGSLSWKEIDKTLGEISGLGNQVYDFGMGIYKQTNQQILDLDKWNKMIGNSKDLRNKANMSDADLRKLEGSIKDISKKNYELRDNVVKMNDSIQTMHHEKGGKRDSLEKQFKKLNSGGYDTVEAKMNLMSETLLQIHETLLTMTEVIVIHDTANRQLGEGLEEEYAAAKKAEQEKLQKEVNEESKKREKVGEQIIELKNSGGKIGYW